MALTGTLTGSAKVPAAAQTENTWDAPMAGTIMAGSGQVSRVRIPMPGLPGLVLELNPPPQYKGSTSVIFVHNPVADPKFGKPSLRLDYGANPRIKGAIDYHWNITRGPDSRPLRDAFPWVDNHLSATRYERVLGKVAKGFRVGGRVFIVVAAVSDIASIAVASNPLRRSLQVISAWELAGVMAVQTGRAGVIAGEVVAPEGGGIPGGLLGAIGGGMVGYWLGNRLGGRLYDWAAGTTFLPAQYVPLTPQ